MVDTNLGNNTHTSSQKCSSVPVIALGSSVAPVEDGSLIREQNRLLPIANVGRIMKQTLPGNAKISKEAKETMQECVSEFISFVTGEASDRCHKEKRKTINGDDICWAISTLGFDDYAEPLKRYLQRYREVEGERANQNKTIGAAMTNFMDGERDRVSNEDDVCGTVHSTVPLRFPVMDRANTSLSNKRF